MCRAVSLIVLIAAVSGCGDTTGPDAIHQRVTSIAVTPDTISITPGAQVQLRAQALSIDGSPVLGRPVTWSSSDTTIATVSTTGLVTTHAAGDVRVIATIGSITGEAVVIADPRRAATVAIEPSTTELLPNQAIQLRVVVRDSAGTLLPHRQVAWQTSNTGMVTVSAAGYARAVGQNGIATVSAIVDGVAGAARIGVLPSPCATTQSIAVGQTVNASLSSAACNLSTGRYSIRYRLDINAATTVTINLRSTAFDAFMYLTDVNGKTIELDDDGAGGNDASIAGRLAAGSYIIWATSFDAGRTGAFTLSVTSEPVQPCSRAAPTTIGRTVDAYLSTLDCRLTTGQYADRYRLALSRTATVRIDMNSGGVDAFLMITDLNGNLILRDDNSAGGSDALIAITLAAGSYIVWASSWDAGDTGGYRLSINYEQPSQCRSVRPVVFGWAISAFLSSSACVMPSGHYADRWRLDLDNARTVRITMSSYWLDSYILVTDLKGRPIASDDDGSGSSDAFMSLYLTAGSYIIWATSYSGYETGNYQLWVR